MSELSEAVGTFSESSYLVADNVSTELLNYTNLSVNTLATEQLFVLNLYVNNEMKFDDHNVNITCQASPANIQLGADLSVPTTGEKNIKLGLQAGRGITTGSYNALIGEVAGKNLLDQTYNIAIGTGAAIANDPVGSSNVCIGSGAGSGALGDNTVAIGVDALATSGSTLNVGLGYQVASAIDLNGDNNVLIGKQVCNVSQIDYNNVVIGANAFLSGNYNNTVVLGNNSFASASKSINIGRENSSTYTNIVLGHAPGGGVKSSCIPGPFTSDLEAYLDPVTPVPLGGLYYNNVGGQPVLCICLHST